MEVDPTGGISANLNNIFLSTNSVSLPTSTAWDSDSVTYSDISYKPLLLNIPAIKESINIQKRNSNLAKSQVICYAI